MAHCDMCESLLPAEEQAQGETMNTTSKYRWELALHIPGCHKYFNDLNTDRIAICDGSGPLPNECDDGVLWLDTDSRRSIEVQLEAKPERLWFKVPLERTDGEHTYCLATVREATMVAKRFALRITATNKDFVDLCGRIEKP
jgi:hypothetical protein